MTLPNNDIFDFVANSWGTHLSSFFTFPICFKCQIWMINVEYVEWSMSSSLATLTVSHYTPHLQGSHLLCKASWKTILSSLHCSTPLSYKWLYISVLICFCPCVDTLLLILPLRVWFEMVIWEYPELIFSHGHTDPTAIYGTTSSEKKQNKN